jgi:hypothetical protein
VTITSLTTTSSCPQPSTPPLSARLHVFHIFPFSFLLPILIVNLAKSS